MGWSTSAPTLPSGSEWNVGLCTRTQANHNTTVVRFQIAAGNDDIFYVKASYKQSVGEYGDYYATDIDLTCAYSGTSEKTTVAGGTGTIYYQGNVADNIAITCTHECGYSNSVTFKSKSSKNTWLGTDSSSLPSDLNWGTNTQIDIYIMNHYRYNTSVSIARLNNEQCVFKLTNYTTTGSYGTWYPPDNITWTINDESADFTFVKGTTSYYYIGTFSANEGITVKSTVYGRVGSITLTAPAYSAITITFDSNGGSEVTTTLYKTPGETYGSLPSTEKAGFKFLGWFAGESETATTADTVITELYDHVLLAMWKRCLPITIWNKNNGNWKSLNITSVFLKNSNTWSKKEITKVYKKENGSWSEIT